MRIQKLPSRDMSWEHLKSAPKDYLALQRYAKDLEMQYFLWKFVENEEEMDEFKKEDIWMVVIGLLVGGSVLFMFLYELITHTDEVLKGIGICALCLGVMYLIGLFIEWKEKK